VRCRCQLQHESSISTIYSDLHRKHAKDATETPSGDHLRTECPSVLHPHPWDGARRLSWFRHGAEAIDELGEPAAVVGRAIQPFSGEPRVRWGRSLELSQAQGGATSIRANSPPPRALFLTLQIETLIAALSDLYISLFVLYVFFGMISFIYEPSTALIQRFLNWKCKSRAIALLRPTRISSGLENWSKRTAISAVLPKPHSRSTAPARFFTARAFQGI